MNKKERKEELIRRFEIRKEQLLAQGLGLKYPLHHGHHLRDIMTILAYFDINSTNAQKDALIRSLPDNEDKPQ